MSHGTVRGCRDPVSIKLTIVPAPPLLPFYSSCPSARAMLRPPPFCAAAARHVTTGAPRAGFPRHVTPSEPPYRPPFSRCHVTREPPPREPFRCHVTKKGAGRRERGARGRRDAFPAPRRKRRGRLRWRRRELHVVGPPGGAAAAPSPSRHGGDRDAEDAAAANLQDPHGAARDGEAAAEPPRGARAGPGCGWSPTTGTCSH